MKKQQKKAGLRSRKGVTIVEVVIALVIISIISASAVDMMLRAVRIESNFTTVTQVKQQAENVLDCFRFCDDADTFSQALQKLGDFTYQDSAYRMEDNAVTITVKVTFSPKKLEYTAEDQDGEQIYSFTYPPTGEGGAP